MVAVLFTREDSIYNTLECDTYPLSRDALTFPGGMPVVAHPPCRLWSKLQRFSTANPEEKILALWAVQHVRLWGGVLEHPAHSQLWQAMALPEPSVRYERDSYGGFSISVHQQWWGHVAQKATWLYICGTTPRELPIMPYCLGKAEKCLGVGRGYQGRHATRRERESTPVAFAQWLLAVAQRTSGNLRA